MASLIVARTGDGSPVYSSLEWSVLAGKGGDNELRASAALQASKSAVRLVSVGEKKRVSAGFYNSLDPIQGKKAYSLAAAFAKWSTEHSDAALCIRVEAEAKEETFYAVVICLDGVPVVDALFKEKSQAKDTMVSYIRDHRIAVYSDDQETFPSAYTEEDLLSTILSTAGKDAQLKDIPLNYVLMVVILLVAVGCWFGYGQYKKEVQRKARIAEAARRAAEDPGPKYSTGLRAALAKAGADAASLEEARVFSGKVSVSVKGWTTEKIECRISIGGCHVSFSRTTGTFSQLVEEVKDLGLVPTKDVNVERAVMFKQIEMKPFAINRPDLLTLTEFVHKGAGNVFQMWKTAGFGVQATVPVLWPRVPGVPSNFKAPDVVLSNDINVSNVGLPQIKELLATAPSGVAWNGFTIDFTQVARGKSVTAKAKIHGAFYVKQS